MNQKRLKTAFCLLTAIFVLNSNIISAKTTENRFLLLRDIAESIKLTQIRSVACNGKYFCFTGVMINPSLFLCSLTGEIKDTIKFPKETFLKSLAFTSSKVAVSDLVTRKVFVYSTVNGELSLEFSVQFDNYPYSVRLNSTYLFVKTFVGNNDNKVPAIVWVNLLTGEKSRTTLIEESLGKVTKESDFFIAANDTNLYAAVQNPFVLSVISFAGEKKDFDLSSVILTEKNSSAQVNLSGEVSSICCNSDTVYLGIKNGPSITARNTFEGVIGFDKDGTFLFSQKQQAHSLNPIISCDATYFYAAGRLDFTRDLATVNFRDSPEWDILQAFRFLPGQEEVITGDGTGQYIYVADEGFGQMLVYSKIDHIEIDPSFVETSVGGGVYYAPYGLDKDNNVLIIRGFTTYFLKEGEETGTIEGIRDEVGGIFTPTEQGTFRVAVRYGDLGWEAETLISKVNERKDSDGDGYSDGNEKIMSTDPNSASSKPSEYGVISFDRSIYYGKSQIAIIKVLDPGLNKDPTLKEECEIQVITTTDPVGITVMLAEWGTDSGLFISNLGGKNLNFSTVQTHVSFTHNFIQVTEGDEVTAIYFDALSDNGKTNVPKFASTLWFESEAISVPLGSLTALTLLIPCLFYLKESKQHLQTSST